MAINFPSPATNGQTYTYNNVLYSYDLAATKWTANNTVDLDARYVNVTGDTMTGDLTVPSLNGGQLAGFRNVLINGGVTINQRKVTYAAASVGDYWADRWKKTGGGMTQIVEDGNYKPSTQYTLSGTGVTTQQITSPATGDWTIPDVPGTATMIQLEEGTVATPFELRPIAMEMTLCQRYYEVIPLGEGLAMSRISEQNDQKIAVNGWFCTEKRVDPALSYPNPILDGHHNQAPAFVRTTLIGFYADYKMSDPGYRPDGGRLLGTMYADAEL